MLTPLTLTAISVLRHISSHETGNLQDLECGCKPLDELLDQLESAGLIRVRTDQSGSGIPKTYEPPSFPYLPARFDGSRGPASEL